MPQFLFLMPIYGMLNKKINQTKFRWLSIRTFLSMLLIFTATCEVVLALCRIYSSGLNFTTFGILFYFSYTLLEVIFLFLLAREWNYFIKYWSKKEMVFLREPYIIKGYRLKTKIRVTVFILLFLAMSGC